jgi:ATP-dependent DNA helicase Q1
MASSSNAASKRAAAEELRLVESKLGEVERQLRALKDERASLLSRKMVLKETVEARDVAADVDWSSDSFPWSGDVERLKAEVFGIAAPWRPDQKEIVNATLSGVDTFVVMRTGGGKSLCFQLPALLPDKGLSLVISPLISLISDQVYQLEEISPGKSAMLTGTMSREESSDVLRRMKDPQSPLRLVYVTPEKVLKSKLLMSALEKLNEAQRLDRFVVDEAHCASSMGNDFRPDYQKLSILRKLFPTVPILAVTATATPQVLRDVTDILQISNVEFFKSPFNRPNLFYRVQHKPASLDDAIASVWTFITERHSGQSGIIYCYSQKECETVAAKLASLGIATGAYHAGLEAEYKDQVLRRWTAGRLQVVVATIAFGMG